MASREVTFYVLADSQKCCCLLTLLTLPLPSETKLSLALWPAISISIFIFVSGVSSLLILGGDRLQLYSPPLPLFPKPTADWVAVQGSPEGRAVCSWTWKERPNCWLLWPLALEMELVFSDSVLLLIAPRCSHAPLKTNTSRARSWGWHRHSERKPSATRILTFAETKFSWHWTRRVRSKGFEDMWCVCAGVYRTMKNKGMTKGSGVEFQLGCHCKCLVTCFMAHS